MNASDLQARVLAASPFVLQVSGSKENALSIAIQPSSE
jgi:hypothetical protein